jgi:tripartite-type tricarboxylate transporter receptor subunit TctC
MFSLGACLAPDTPVIFNYGADVVSQHLVHRSLKACVRLGLVSAGAAVITISQAVADPVASFYRGKAVSIIVGTPPGGGFDLYGRLLARHWGRSIPGEPALILRNMPGGGGITQVNYMMQRAARDGTQISIVNPVMTTAPFLTPSAAKWDSREFVWIGSANTEVSTCGFWPHSSIKSLDDLRAGGRELIIAGVGPSTGVTLDAITLRSMFNWNWKIVTGYPGLAQAMMSADGRETEGMCGLNVTTLKARVWDRVKSGEIKILLQTSLKNHPDLPDVANAFDLARTPEQKSMMEIVFGPWTFGRPFMTTADVPAERLAALRESFKNVLADPQLLAEAAKMQSEISYMAPDEITGLVNRLYAISPELREKTRLLLDVQTN